MKRFKILILSILFLTTVFIQISYSKDVYIRPAIYTQGKYYQSDYLNLKEDELVTNELYVEVSYNSKGKLLEEKFFMSELVLCRRIYSPRFDKVLREELYEWDEQGNKTIFETKNYYKEKSTFIEKKILTVVNESNIGERKGLYVEYELFSTLKDIEITRIKQRYEQGKLKFSWIYYYDDEGTLIIIEERNADNEIVRIGRTDYYRYIISEENVDEKIVWTNY